MVAPTSSSPLRRRPRRPRRRLRFAGHVLVLQLAVVSTIVVITTAVFVWSSVQSMMREAGATALAIAQSVAEDPGVRSEVAALSAGDEAVDPAVLRDGPLLAGAEAVRVRTGALFVVLTDDRGIRLAHPDPSALGRPVSTSPDAALGGDETVSWETGTLGNSARAKVPVYAPGSTAVVGEVSVGFAPARVFATIVQDTTWVVAAASVALLLGFIASVLIGRRLRRLTLGLQPEELITLVQNQAAVLGGVGEGVLGVSPAGRVTVCNDHAVRLLALDNPVGKLITELGLSNELLALIRDPAAPDSVQLVAAARVLFIDVRTVEHQEHRLGRVVIVRDRTDVEALTRRLTAVSTMTSALRAQRHEFANRLHAISGLLEIGQQAEARRYLANVLDHGPLRYPVEHADRLTEPYLQAFLGAKGVEAAERGVVLRLGPETFVDGSLADPEDVTTVLGNLIDNAVAAAVNGMRRPAWVEVELLDAGTELHIAVMDSGAGLTDWSLAFERAAELDADRADTAAHDDAAHGHGIGLPLSLDIARRRGGDLWLASPGDHASHGAVFCARLPGAVTPPPPPRNEHG